jgi:aldehyde:ferredoxin oxidoreductase
MPEVVTINLTDATVSRETRPELFGKYIGGSGLAAALLDETLDSSAEPLSPENVIVLSAGPLTPYFPCVTKTAAVFRSPLTGEYGESHAGGKMACALRMAGFDALVITGRAQRPSYISIADDKIKLRDARTLWGMSSVRTVARILRERYDARGLSIAVIGKAGENSVAYASVTVDSFRHFGRLGLGAVMGAKNLKGLVVSGTGELPIPYRKKYKEVYRKVFDRVVKTEAMTKYHDLGTAVNVTPLNLLGGLPTRNFTSGSFESAEGISGEAFARELLVRQTACMHCPIGCIHVASLREQFGPEHEFSTVEVNYDYELLYALGSNLGIGSSHDVLRLIDLCESAGLDAISTGVALAWATEALASGELNLHDTDLVLSFGNVEGYIEGIERIARREDRFWHLLGDGVEKAAAEYGGKEFAIAYGGAESPGYHTGAGAIAGAMLGLRHSHLDNAGYSLDQKNLEGYPSGEYLADAIIEEESVRQVVTSLHSCLFARKVYTPEVVVECFESIGRPFANEELKEAGRRIFDLKNKLRKKLGFDISSLRIPGRVLETPTPSGMVSRQFLREVLEAYKRKTDT